MFPQAGGRIKFECGVCHRKSHGIGEIPQCLECSKPICEHCNRGNLCPDHFKRLNPMDQDKVERLAMKDRTPPVWIFMFVPVLVFPIFFSVVFAENLETGAWIAGIIVPFLTIPILITILFFVLLKKQEHRRMDNKTQIRMVVHQYQTNAPTSSGNIPSSMTQNLMNISNNSKQDLVCAQCGSALQSGDLKFCPYCGSQLK